MAFNVHWAASGQLESTRCRYEAAKAGECVFEECRNKETDSLL